MLNKKNNYNLIHELVKKMKSTCLGLRGYEIMKSDLSDIEKMKIENELTVKPKCIIDSSLNNYELYRESLTRYYVPRYYGYDKFGLPQINKLKNGDTINCPFMGTLRDSQELVVNKCINDISNNNIICGGGLIQLPCGYGKTVIGLSMISKLSKKTLIIVHKSFLMDQWKSRISQFLPNAKIGIIQGQQRTIESKDIVLAMIHTLCQQDFDIDYFNSFGLTIIDEVHHISSKMFSNCLFKICTIHMIGLSATMERLDGTSYVLNYFFGPLLFEGERDEDRPATIWISYYKSNDKEFNTIPTIHIGSKDIVNSSTLLTRLHNYEPRKEFIYLWIEKLWKEEIPKSNEHGQILVFCHQLCLVHWLEQKIKHTNLANGNVGCYIRKKGNIEKQQKLLEEAGNCDIVLLVYVGSKEGLDLPRANMLLLATPSKHVEQVVGRILRSKKEYALVVDIVDNHCIYKNQSSVREKFYKEQGFKIEKNKQLK